MVLTAIIGTAYVAIRPDAGQFNSEVTSGVASVAKRAFAVLGGALAVSKVAEFFKGSIAAARESNKVAAQTDAVLKSTQGAAGLTSKAISDLANSISRKTGIDDEAIQSAENLLQTFTNVRNEAGKGNDIFNQATRSIVDLSVAMGTDAKGAAIQVGKALNDPIKGITALTRVGVTFSEGQKKLIERLVETGDKAGAQKVILAELNKEFGGSAAAVATTGDKFKVFIGNLQETVGNALIPIIENVQKFFIDVLPRAFAAIREGFSAFLDFISPVTDFVRDNLQPILIGVAAALLTVLVPALAAAGLAAASAAGAFLLAAAPFVFIAAVVAGAVLAFQKFEIVRTIVETVVNAIRTVIETVVGAIQEFWRNFGDEILAIAVFAFNTVKATIETVIGVIRVIIETVVGGIQAFWKRFGDNILDFITIAFEAIRTVIETVINVIRGIIEFVLAIIRGDWKAAWEAIAGVIDTVWDGIKGVIDLAIRAVKNVIATVLDVIAAIWKPAWQALKRVIENVWDAITGVVRTAAAIIGGIIGGIVGAIQSAIDTLVSLLNLLNPFNSNVSSLIDGLNGARPSGSSGLGPSGSREPSTSDTGVRDNGTGRQSRVVQNVTINEVAGDPRATAAAVSTRLGIEATR